MADVEARLRKRRGNRTKKRAGATAATIALVGGSSTGLPAAKGMPHGRGYTTIPATTALMVHAALTSLKVHLLLNNHQRTDPRGVLASWTYLLRMQVRADRTSRSPKQSGTRRKGDEREDGRQKPTYRDKMRTTTTMPALFPPRRQKSRRGQRVCQPRGRIQVGLLNNNLLYQERLLIVPIQMSKLREVPSGQIGGYCKQPMTHSPCGAQREGS